VPSSLADADALVWMTPTSAGDLRALLDDTTRAGGRIRWVQLPWAGVEHFAAAGLFDPLAGMPGLVWTCAKGVYAEPVAEHALALALAGLRSLPDRVRANSWGPQAGRSLYDAQVTILGAGGITASLIDLLRPMRTEVTVVRRSDGAVDGAARTLLIDRLDEALPDADVVFVALALTPATTGILGSAQLSAMARHAWLVNVGRGRHVVTDDLVTALEAGEIGGAALDVTDPEPLPDHHPLWAFPNVIITPHTANTEAMARPLLARRIADNVARFGAGDTLAGLVDPLAGY